MDTKIESNINGTTIDYAELISESIHKRLKEFERQETIKRIQSYKPKSHKDSMIDCSRKY